MKKLNNTEYKERAPILLNKNAVALIQIFKKHDIWEDFWIIDTEYQNGLNYKDAAEQFVDQLDEEWCDAFIEELAVKCTELYKKNREAVGCGNDYVKLLDRIKKL